jgi:hypothetical protein
MGVMINTGTDVIAFLEAQHEDIRVLLERVASTSGAARAEAFLILRKTLAVHETAEAEIVHPAARHAIGDGERLVRARLDEESAVKRALDELEPLDVDSRAFTTKLGGLRMLVLLHAFAEERDEFAVLANRFDHDRLERMRKAAQLAEAIAPRPRPDRASASANLLVGPFASMLDRSRDALAGDKQRS